MTDVVADKLMKRLLPLITLLSLAMYHHETFAGTPMNWTPSFLVGYGFTNADTQQDLRLANTPEPGLTNRYLGSNRLYGAGFFGLAFENLYEAPFHGWMGHLGIEGDYLRNNSVNGRLQPLVNVAPDFDELKYFYDIHSVILQVTGKLTKENVLPHLDGYVQAGVGGAMNRLSDYREYAPNNSSAAPMLAPFGNNDQLNLSLSAGIGISHKMGQYTRASFGYRYIYAGQASLGSSRVQQTSASIELSPVSYHVLILELSLGQV